MKKKLLNLLNKLNNAKPERVCELKAFFVPRSRAYLCANCDAIGASSKRCPRCESVALLNLSKFIQEHDHIQEHKHTLLALYRPNEDIRSRT
jgi:hypothetical protein